MSDPRVRQDRPTGPDLKKLKALIDDKDFIDRLIKEYESRYADGGTEDDSDGVPTDEECLLEFLRSRRKDWRPE